MFSRQQKKVIESITLKVSPTIIPEYFIASKEMLEALEENSNSSTNLACSLFFFSLTVATFYTISWSSLTLSFLILFGVAILTLLLGIQQITKFLKKRKKSEELLKKIYKNRCILNYPFNETHI